MTNDRNMFNNMYGSVIALSDRALLSVIQPY